MSTMPRFIPDAECVQSKCANSTTGCRDVCMMRNPGWVVAPNAPVAPIGLVSDSTAAEGQWMGDDTLPAAPAPTDQAGELPPLTEEEFDFIMMVVESSGSKMSIACNGQWERPEGMGLVQCVGSYKWKPTAKLRGLFRAALAARQAPIAAPKLNLCEHMWELQPASTSVRMTEKCRFCHEIHEIATAQEKAQ